MLENVAPALILSDADPAPVQAVEGAPGHPLLLVCEHAGCAIPMALGSLGVAEATLEDHVAWDIGAAGLTRRIAARLGAPALLQPFSRLVIDCNRPPEALDAMPAEIHGVTVPGNRDPGSRGARVREIFAPFQAEVARRIAEPGRRLLISVHSFTPKLGGAARPWEIGLCYREDAETAGRLARALTARRPGLVLGMNQPYGIDDAGDWFVPRQAEPSGLAHCLIEIRNDLVAELDGQSLWGDLLADAIADLILQGDA